MPRDKDYYKILGVARDADPEAIKKAYRRLARKYHPDLHPGDKSKEASIKEINEAYGVLGDQEKRERYDLGGRVRFEGSPFGGAGAGAGGFNVQDFGAATGDIGDIFGDIFGGAGRAGRGPRVRRSVPTRGEDIEYALDIDFMQAVKGTDVRISVTKGAGPEKIIEKITVKIPPGVNDGSRVRVPGRGSPGLFNGPRGDFYLRVRVRPHAYFKRVDNDIYLDVPITVTEALLGARVEVPTLDGTATVKVPPGTQGGQRLRLKGKGVAPGRGVTPGQTGVTPGQTGVTPGRTGSSRGSQYIVIKITLPVSLDKRSRELVREFAEINSYEPRKGLW